jgi:hypothetical protein
MHGRFCNLPCFCRNVPKLINDPNMSCDCPWGHKQGVADSRPFSCSCNPGFHAQGNGTTFVDCFKCHKPNCNRKLQLNVSKHGCRWLQPYNNRSMQPA